MTETETNNTTEHKVLIQARWEFCIRIHNFHERILSRAVSAISCSIMSNLALRNPTVEDDIRFDTKPRWPPFYNNKDETTMMTKTIILYFVIEFLFASFRYQELWEERNLLLLEAKKSLPRSWRYLLNMEMDRIWKNITCQIDRQQVGRRKFELILFFFRFQKIYL